MKCINIHNPADTMFDFCVIWENTSDSDLMLFNFSHQLITEKICLYFIIF